MSGCFRCNYLVRFAYFSLFPLFLLLFALQDLAGQRKGPVTYAELLAEASRHLQGIPCSADLTLSLRAFSMYSLPLSCESPVGGEKVLPRFDPFASLAFLRFSSWF